jgi:hypothetical protein
MTRTEWLTVAQVCADLQVTEAEWEAWRAAGDTPLHIAMPSGELRLRAADYAQWLDARTVDDDAPQARTEARTGTEPDPYGNPYAYGNPHGFAPFRPIAAYWRQRIRDAIDATGERGLSRSEIWAILGRSKSGRQFNEVIAELLASQAYEEIIVRTGEGGRPPVRYRRRKPSHEARADASRVDRPLQTRRVTPDLRDASRAAGDDASRPTSEPEGRL